MRKPKYSIKNSLRFNAIRDYVVQTYFPKWDWGQWSFFIWPKPLEEIEAGAVCSWDRRQIIFRFGDLPTDWMIYLFIHEIAHAVIPGGHNQQWADRMMMAAQKAKELGETEIVERIKRDIAECGQALEGIAPETIYAEIAELVKDELDWTGELAEWQYIEGLILEEHPAHKDVFYQRYPQAQQVYEQTIQQLRSEYELDNQTALA